jgi:hypothetical protein
MDDALAEFLQQLPQTARESLDYAAASLDVLERWLLDRYQSLQHARSAPDGRVGSSMVQRATLARRCGRASAEIGQSN